MALSPPMEDYLEAIQILDPEGRGARVKDLAGRLSVSRPSVVGAVRALRERGLVEQERYGAVTLTDAGREIAGEILHRHEVLVAFLEQVLGLDATTATRDACRIEHAACPDTILRLQALATFLLQDGHPDLRWSEEFAAFLARREGKP